MIKVKNKKLREASDKEYTYDVYVGIQGSVQLSITSNKPLPESDIEDIALGAVTIEQYTNGTIGADLLDYGDENYSIDIEDIEADVYDVQYIG